MGKRLFDSGAARVYQRAGYVVNATRRRAGGQLFLEGGVDAKGIAGFDLDLAPGKYTLNLHQNGYKEFRREIESVAGVGP